MRSSSWRSKGKKRNRKIAEERKGDGAVDGEGEEAGYEAKKKQDK